MTGKGIAIINDKNHFADVGKMVGHGSSDHFVDFNKMVEIQRSLRIERL